MALCEWVASLAKRVQHSTIKQYLSAVNSMHTDAGYPSATVGCIILQRVCRGAARVYGDRSSRLPRFPISYSILTRVVSLLDLSHVPSLVFATACTVGFFGFLRSGEFTYTKSRFDPAFDLTRGSVAFFPSATDPLYVSLTLPSSKTDPFRHGMTIHVGRAAGSGPCAVTLLQRLFIAHPLPPASPLFQGAQAAAFTKPYLVSSIRSLLPRLGEDPARYSGHSFRIGGATAAAAHGYSPHEIQVLGRWRSDAYLVYLRLSDSRRAGLAAALSSPLPGLGFPLRGLGAGASFSPGTRPFFAQPSCVGASKSKLAIDVRSP